MKKIIGLTLILLIAIVFSGCGNSMPYPELYLSEGLPQYENAKVTQTIKDGPTLKDGNLFILESVDDVKTIAAYYDEAMKGLGWNMITANEATETSYATQYNGNNGKYVQMTVSQLKAGATTISINFMEQ
jgi:hypothetical protein